MTIEIANRLQKLRKENGYSQDELAEKLGISRQAISKWERSESSPDTDNLIELAKLYNVSLDELIYGKEISEEEKQEIVQEVVENRSHENSQEPKEEKRWLFRGIYDSIASVLTIAAFFIWGFCFDGFYVSWVLFIMLIAIQSVPEVIIRKRISAFAFPCLICACYLYMGMEFGMWHPWWLLFLLIPVFYTLANFFDKYVLKTKKVNE